MRSHYVLMPFCLKIQETWKSPLHMSSFVQKLVAWALRSRASDADKTYFCYGYADSEVVADEIALVESDA